MNLKKQNILLFSRTMGQGGAEKVVMQLCKVLLPVANKIVVCSSGGVNVEKLTEMGIEHYKILDIEDKSVATILKNLKIISGIIRKEKITIIHSHHRMAAFYARLLGLKNRIILINTVHNTFTDKKILTKISYSRSKVIACGDQVKKNLVNFYGINSQRITTIRNAVEPVSDEIIINPILESLREDNYYLVGNIGRLSKQKGMSFFIKAMAFIPESYKMKFVIIGTGEELASLMRLTKTLGVEKRIVFLGFQEHIQSIMKQLDIVVLSSLWEGLPLTPIESFSVGTAVIGTSVGGTVEIIRDKENGLLIKSKSAKDIAQKIIYLYSNPDEKKRLEKNSIQTYNEKFDYKIFCDNILKFYSNITN